MPTHFPLALHLMAWHWVRAVSVPIFLQITQLLIEDKEVPSQNNALSHANAVFCMFVCLNNKSSNLHLLSQK